MEDFLPPERVKHKDGRVGRVIGCSPDGFKYEVRWENNIDNWYWQPSFINKTESPYIRNSYIPDHLVE